MMGRIIYTRKKESENKAQLKDQMKICTQIRFILWATNNKRKEEEKKVVKQKPNRGEKKHCNLNKAGHRSEPGQSYKKRRMKTDKIKMKIIQHTTVKRTVNTGRTKK